MELNLSGVSNIWGEKYLDLNKDDKTNNISIDDLFEGYLKSNVEESNKTDRVSAVSEKEGIMDTILNMNKEQVESTNLMTDVLNGKSEDIHGALIAAEKANTKMQLAVKIRDELIQTYEKMINIQI